MKIVSSETGVVSIPREEGPLTGGMGNNAEFVTIKIRTEDEICLGEGRRHLKD